MKTSFAIDLDISLEEFKQAQQSDQRLKRYRQLAETGETTTSKTSEWTFVFKSILYRIYKSIKRKDIFLKQVLVPISLRNKFVKLAHEGVLAGHLASRKTVARILENFFWPHVWGDVH